MVRGNERQLLCWLKTSRMCNKKKILIMDLQRSNKFYFSATSEEGPKQIKFWEAGFSHSFIAPRQDFKAVSETCLSTWVQGWASTAPSQPSEAEFWALGLPWGRKMELIPMDNLHLLKLGCLIPISAGPGCVCSLISLAFACSIQCRWLQQWIQFSQFWTAIRSRLCLPNHTNIKNSLGSSGPPFCPRENQQEARKEQH